MTANEDRPVLRPFAVARCRSTRGHFYPAWMVGVYDALKDVASEKAVTEVIHWAVATSCPRSYAQALVVVFETRHRDLVSDGVAGSAFEVLRLLQQSMRDLGDTAPPPRSPDEARKY